MRYQFIITCFTALFIRVVTNAQIDSLNVNSGIYFSQESIKANRPDVLTSRLIPTTIVELFTPTVAENTLRLNCINVLSYYDENENILNVPASKVRLLAEGGNLFVSHETSFKYCFEKLLMFGRLSRFFTRKDFDGSVTMKSYAPPTFKVKEFIVDLSTGKVYNMTSERSKIRSIIKKDERFANEKISSSNIDHYIKQFNELNPIISELTN
jgi:hypothetical protein